MRNKFLEKYPVFWEPKIDDKVIITNLLGCNKQKVTVWGYNVGDIGYIQSIFDMHGTYGIILQSGKVAVVYKEEIVPYHDPK